MLQLDCVYSFSQVPYLLYDVLEEYAEKVIADATPECLRQPIPVDVETFLEFYLGLQVEYKKLS